MQTDLHASDAGFAFDLGDSFAFEHANAQLFRLSRDRASARSACIDDRRNREARVFQNDCSAVCVVVVGDNNGAITNRHAPVHNVVTNRSSQKDARNIVASKGQRTFNRASSCDDVTCTDAPQAVTWTRFVGQVVRQTLVTQNIAVVVDASRHITVAHGDIWHRVQRREGFLHPSLCRFAIDFDAIHNSTTTKISGLFKKQNLLAGLTFFQCSRQTSDTAADNQHVTEVVEVFVGIRVFFLRHLTQTSRLTDEGFIDVLPEGARMDEHFVVEASRQPTGEQLVHGTDVELKARPVVLRTDRQTVKDFLRGGALVRFKTTALAHVKERVRLFCARSHNTTRTVVFERTANHHLVVCEQSRRERIALVAFKTLTVEFEFDRFRTVDQTTGICQTGAHAVSFHDQSGYFARMFSVTSAGGSVVWAG